jgi:hypothetical protein
MLSRVEARAETFALVSRPSASPTAVKHYKYSRFSGFPTRWRRGRLAAPRRRNAGLQFGHLRATASLVDTTSPPRRGELVRQAIQHAEHGFHAVAREERKRRCAQRADGIGNDVLGGRKEADRHPEHRAKH